MRIIKVIAQQTLRDLFRSSRFIFCGIILWVLLLAGLLLSCQQRAYINKERIAAQKISRQNWLTQTPKNPHKAAHFGNYAYRLASVLSLFDNGLNNFTGTSIYLEPHKSDNFQFTPAEDATGMLRFGNLTPAFVLQTILPLLLIFISFNAITEEREQSTSRLLLGQGAALKHIAAGKTVGIFTGSWMLLFPFFIVFAFLLIPNVVPDDCIRLLLLILGYAIYTFTVVTICVVISAYSRRSSQALMRLLGCWIISCILLPKLAGNAGSFFYTTPSQFAYSNMVKHDEENGLNGHDPHDKRRDALLKAVLKNYHVNNADSLPVNFDAIAMIESEKYTTAVYRKRMKQVRDIFRHQNRFAEYSAFINPYQAMQMSSSALSGTDYLQFCLFQDKAEDYRLYFVNEMNDFMAKHTRSGDWSTPFGQEVFAAIKPFDYSEPNVKNIISQNCLPFIALLFMLPICLFLLLTLKVSPL